MALSHYTSLPPHLTKLSYLYFALHSHKPFSVPQICCNNSDYRVFLHAIPTITTDRPLNNATSILQISASVLLSCFPLLSLQQIPLIMNPQEVCLPSKQLSHFELYIGNTQLTMIQLDNFFHSMMMQNQYALNRNCTLNFVF